MVGWYHQLNEHEFEQALGVHDGQGGLACCGPWGHKESERLSLLLGGKAMTKLDSVLKIKDVTLPTKVHIIKAMVFPVVHNVQL